ncbi:MAG: hypothetical protein Q8N84_01505 [bacterium]|nr:hypothetical protein [bacterium]
MVEIKSEANENLFSLLIKLQNTAETEVIFIFPDQTGILGNILNLKMLRREGERLGKTVAFKAEGEAGQNLIAALAEGPMAVSASEAEISQSVESVKVVSVGSKRFWPPKIPHVSLSLPRMWKIGLGVLLLLLVGGIVLSYWRVPRATVRLKVQSQELVKSLEVLASPSAQAVDFDRRIIPAVVITVEERGEKTQETTGKKTVGEKARGKVTIYNRTDAAKTFGAGTGINYSKVEGDTIKTLKFKLEEEVTVPAQTSTVSAETRIYFSGKAENVPVTAEEIGPDFNLPAETSFTVHNLSTEQFLAKNTASFTGGEQHEVKTVVEDDQKALVAILTEELKAKSVGSLQAKLVGDQKLEAGATNYKTKETKFDHELNDEAEKVKLDLTLEATALAYSQAQLVELLTKLLANFVPGQYTLTGSDQNVEVAVSKIDEQGRFLQFQAKVKGYVRPKFDLEKLKKDLAGQKLDQAQKILSSLQGVESSSISVWPPLPGFMLRLPHVASRILVEIQGDGR